MGRNDGIDEHEDHELDLESDELLQLVANAAFDSLDPGDPANDAFFDWFAKHARARRTDAEKRADARLAQEFGRRMAMRWAGRSLGVAARGSGPALHAPPVNASVAAALDIMPIATRAPHLDMAVAAGRAGSCGTRNAPNGRRFRRGSRSDATSRSASPATA